MYQLVTLIQKYLHVNKVYWKLIESPEFEDLCNVLDNVMKERTEAQIGTVKRQAKFITYEFENELWEKGFLGDNSPDRLRDTVLFLIGINCTLHAGDEHYQLRREMPNKKSQLQFEMSDLGEKCLVYYEDPGTKSNDGGLKQIKIDRKIVWVHPNNVHREHCPVRLVEKYLSLCLKYEKKENFYLQSLQKLTPKQWYAEQVVGLNTIYKVIKTMFSDARIERFFTGRSLRRSGTTRMFQAGIDRKIIKEITGHRSDAVDAYQETSVEQKRLVSNVIAHNPTATVVKESSDNSTSRDVIELSNANDKEPCKSAIDSAVSVKKVNDIGCLVTYLVQSNIKKGKTKIKIEIEITHE